MTEKEIELLGLYELAQKWRRMAKSDYADGRPAQAEERERAANELLAIIER